MGNEGCALRVREVVARDLVETKRPQFLPRISPRPPPVLFFVVHLVCLQAAQLSCRPLREHKTNAERVATQCTPICTNNRSQGPALFLSSAFTRAALHIYNHTSPPNSSKASEGVRHYLLAVVAHISGHFRPHFAVHCSRQYMII
jgi:hypothetical protein